MKHLVNIDLNQNELQNAVVQPLATAPSSGKLGQIYYNSTDKKTYQYNGTAWVAIGITDVATTSANGLMSSSDKTKLNGIATGAEVNQNAFSNVKVGSTTVAADAKTDTLELVAGSNVTLTPDATNDKVTIAATDTTYSVVTAGTSTSAGGLMSQADKTKLNGISAGAEVNQNAFSNVTVGSTTIAADAKTDTLTLVAGSNVTLTPDATNDKVTIAATDTTYSAGTQALLETGTDTANRVWQPKILHDYISSTVGAADAMRFKGTIGTGGTVTSLPESGVKIGDTYRVITAGTYAGQTCEIGDLIIATETTPAWTVAQTNIDGAITSISGTAPITVSGSGSSRTIAISAASGSAAGSMSKAHYTKLEGIAAGAEVNQNAFSNVKIGSTTVAADTKTDTLELAAGTNITLTPDATNDKVTIATSAEVNVLEGVQVAGSDLTVTNKKVNVPKATSSDWGVVKVINGNPEGSNTYMGLITRSNGSSDGSISFPTLDAEHKISPNVMPPASSSAAGSMSKAHYTKLEGIAAGAEVNQNTFSNVKVGSTTIAADTKTDTLTLAAGSNVTLTPDATNDKVTIAASHPTFTAFTGKPTANASPGFGDTVTISQISQSTSGQVSGTDRTITIPSTIATTSKAGLMSEDDKLHLDELYGALSGTSWSSGTIDAGQTTGTVDLSNFEITGIDEIMSVISTDLTNGVPVVIDWSLDVTNQRLVGSIASAVAYDIGIRVMCVPTA